MNTPGSSKLYRHRHRRILITRPAVVAAAAGPYQPCARRFCGMLLLMNGFDDPGSEVAALSLDS